MSHPTRSTRREFLKRSASAFALPTLISSTALGADGRAPASDRITMGFIGIGTQGGGHLCGGAWTYLAGGYLGRDDVQVLGVCDVSLAKRDRALKRVNDYYAGKAGTGTYKACKAYVDFRNLLARDDIDAVLIAPANHSHAPISIMALQAGKDVYCEKPTAVTIGEGQEVARAAREYGRVYQAGSQQRSEYGGKFRQACEYVRSGRIGKLQTVYAVRGFNGCNWPIPAGKSKPQVTKELDGDLLLGSMPEGGRLPGTFSYGGNWEQHHFDIVQWGIGADRAWPVEVSGKELKYANGVVIRPGPYPGERIGNTGGCCFVGTEGRIAVDRENLAAYPPKIIETPLGPNDVHLYNRSSHSGNFLECIRTRQATICDAETAKRSAGLPILGGIGALLSRTLKWDPEKEVFIGDAEANRLLSYARRPLPPIRQEEG